MRVGARAGQSGRIHELCDKIRYFLSLSRFNQSATEGAMEKGDDTKTLTESQNNSEEMTKGSKNEEASVVVTEQPKSKEEEAAARGDVIG